MDSMRIAFVDSFGNSNGASNERTMTMDGRKREDEDTRESFCSLFAYFVRNKHVTNSLLKYFSSSGFGARTGARLASLSIFYVRVCECVSINLNFIVNC